MKVIGLHFSGLAHTTALKGVDSPIMSSAARILLAPDRADEATARPTIATHGTATTALSTLMAICSADPDREHRRRLVAEDMDALDALEELDRAIALGTAEPGLLQRLAAKAERQMDENDPACLAQIRQDILLRVRVELAKLGR